MKATVQPDLKFKTFCINKSYTPQLKKENTLVNIKFYQKLLVLLISFSTILIFPESPRDLGNICESYHSRKTCKVW